MNIISQSIPYGARFHDFRRLWLPCLFGRCSAVVVTVLIAATDPFFICLLVLSYYHKTSAGSALVLCGIVFCYSVGCGFMFVFSGLFGPVFGLVCFMRLVCRCDRFLPENKLQFTEPCSLGLIPTHQS